MEVSHQLLVPLSINNDCHMNGRDDVDGVIRVIEVESSQSITTEDEQEEDESEEYSDKAGIEVLGSRTASGHSRSGRRRIRVLTSRFGAFGRLVRSRLRSSSDSDRGSAVSSLSGEESYQRSRSSTSHDASGSGRDTVWVTDASHPVASQTYVVGGGSNLVDYLNDLPLPSTSIPASGTVSTPDVGSLDIGSQSAPLASSPVPISAQAMQKTVYQSIMESGSSTATSSHPPLERKSSKPKQQPKGTFEYTVKDGDTLDRIGAHFNVTPSELVKINKLLSRTVFAGQIMFIPDPNFVPSDPKASSPVAPPAQPGMTSPTTQPSPTGVDNRPKVDIPLANMGDRSPPAVPGHVVQVATSPVFKPSPPSRQQSENEMADDDNECLQKFVKVRSRRVLEEDETDESSFGGVTCRGTLLVTPNAIMFDPDVNDSFVIQNGGQAKFSAVVYMENIKSVALYPDMSPRIFWRQPKEIRSRSPRPEPYKPDASDHVDSKTVSQSGAGDVRQAPDGISMADDSSQRRHSPEGGNEQTASNSAKEKHSGTRQRRMSDELEDMNEISQKLPVSPSQPGRTSEEVEHMLTSSGDFTPDGSHLQHQMSRSSELAVSEIALFDEVSKEIGATRDFGPHMGRSSSEMSKQGLPGAQNRMFISSPRESINSSLPVDRSDSTNDNLNTPTQGFAPVFFTDRSPNSAIAAPKPVPGQKNALHLSDLGSLSEDTSALEKRLSGDGNSGLEDQTSGSGTGNNTVEENQGSNIPGKTPDNSNENISDSVVSDSQKGNDTDLSSKEPTEPKRISSSLEEVTDRMHQLSTDNEEVNSTQELPSDSADGRAPPGSTMDASTKSSISSPLSSSFSPLRTPAQHISSFFNYTTGFFRASDKDKGGTGTSPGIASTQAAEDSALNKISKNLPSFPFPSSLIPSAFSNSSSPPTFTSATSTSAANSDLPWSNSSKTKEDLSQVLGPPPSSYLPRSDSPQFVVSPMYLQIRTGVPNNQDPDVPKHHAIVREVSGKLMEEYWFVIPRDVTNKLYKFLIHWQPDAYGDQEDCQGREKYFYDTRDVSHLIKGDIKGSDLEIHDDYYGLDMTWEIVGHDREAAEDDVSTNNSGQPKQGAEEPALPEFLNGTSAILGSEHVMKLMSALPRNMSVGYDWTLIYSTTQHGFSLQQLYREMRLADNDCPVILCLLDTDHTVFGAYLSNIMRVSEGFYGSGTTFLFTFYPEFKHYHWQGDNCYFMNGTRDSFAIGSGEGLFGLWLDGDLDKGRSHMCTTFGNDVLTTNEDFHIVNLEVWQLTDTTT